MGQILDEKSDVFRINLGRDPSAKVTPFQFRKKPDARSYREKNSRHAPTQDALIIETVK